MRAPASLANGRCGVNTEENPRNRVGRVLLDPPNDCRSKSPAYGRGFFLGRFGRKAKILELFQNLDVY